jgi:hypothetical protein
MRNSKAAFISGLLYLTVQAAATQEKPGGAQGRSFPMKRQTSTTQTQKAAKRNKLFGTLQSVDAASRGIVVKTAAGEIRRIEIPPRAKLDRGSCHKRILLPELKSGDLLAITMEGHVIHAIHVYLTPK